jgi:hypothetical protein
MFSAPLDKMLEMYPVVMAIKPILDDHERRIRALETLLLSGLQR